MYFSKIRIILYFQSGEYVLGFQIKPEERLEYTCKTIQALLNAFQSSPIFGIQYIREEGSSRLSGDTLENIGAQETEEQEPNEKPLRLDAFAVFF